MDNSHRFPNNETCEKCTSRRWYLQSGRRFCQNGHQVEGYIQFDIDEDDNFGQKGRTIRKKEAAKETERRHYEGNEAKELYLECLQIILRKQIAWLVANRGLSKELEQMCKDLWDLRIRNFVGLTPAPVVGGGGKKKMAGAAGGVDKKKPGSSSSQKSQQSGSDTEMVMYSSQGENSSADERVRSSNTATSAVGNSKKSGRVRNWATENWALPGAIDTLALLYLGCLLRQDPVRIGDIYRWAKAGELPYLSARDLAPKELLERLPAWGHKSLLTRYATFEGSELHEAVMTLMMGYGKNYNLKFPAPPIPSLLLTYLKDLALTPDVYIWAQKICQILDLTFSFPTRQNLKKGGVPPVVKGAPTDPHAAAKYTLLDLPDALLAASVALAAKFIYPMDGVERAPRGERDPLTLKLDWNAWEEAMRTSEERQEKRRKEKQQRGGAGAAGAIALAKRDFEKMEPEEIWKMSDEEVQLYLDWFQETQIAKEPRDEYEEEMVWLFPSQQPKSKSTNQHLQNNDANQEHQEGNNKTEMMLEEEEKISTMNAVQKAMKVVTVTSKAESKDPKPRRLGEGHKRYKDVSELPATGPVRAFHEKVAQVSGLSTNDLLGVIYRMEQLMYEWETAEKRRRRDGQ